MDKEILKLGNIKIKKRKFHHRKNLILLEHKDTDSILISRRNKL